MNEVAGTYLELLERFLTRKLSLMDFQRAYLRQFKDETRDMDDALFELLDEFFGDLDSFSADPALLAARPDFYLDEAGLRDKAENVLLRLRAGYVTGNAALTT